SGRSRAGRWVRGARAAGPAAGHGGGAVGRSRGAARGSHLVAGTGALEERPHGAVDARGAPRAPAGRRAHRRALALRAGAGGRRAEETRDGALALRVGFDDYRDGFPHLVEVAVAGGAAARLAYDAVEPNAPVDPALFAPPPASRVLPLEAAALPEGRGGLS